MLWEIKVMIRAEPGFYLLLVICTVSFLYGVKVVARWISDDSFVAVLGFILALWAATALYLIMQNTTADDQLASWLWRFMQAVLTGAGY